MHIVVVRYRAARSAIFALDGNLPVVLVLRDLESPDTTAKALADAVILRVGL